MIRRPVHPGTSSARHRCHCARHRCRLPTAPAPAGAPPDAAPAGGRKHPPCGQGRPRRQPGTHAGLVAERFRDPQTERVTQGWAQARPITLVGREPELERLAGASRAARAGQGKIVLVSGEPGIGKTAILASLVGRAAADGARIAAGAAEELEQRVPFAAISDCLGLSAAADRRAAEISALLRGTHRPSGGTFSAADAEFLITEAILGLVDWWCAAGAVVLAVDDLQWADQESLLALHGSAGSRASCRCCWRPPAGPAPAGPTWSGWCAAGRPVARS